MMNYPKQFDTVKNKDYGLVSIIMPAYNCEKLIGTTIESVINQSYKNWELIVVDDCSSDNTYGIVKRYMKKDRRIKLYKLDKNSGPAMARNKAIEKAKGKYLAFLDSDDIWFPDKLRKQLHFMEENNYLFSCTSYTKIDENGNELNQIVYAKKKSDYNGVLKTCPGNSTVIYNAEQLGKFKIPNIKKRNDYVLWLKVIKKARYLYGLDEPLSSHRVRKGSVSSKKISLIKYHWIVYRKYEGLSLLKSSYLVLYWVFATAFKLRIKVIKKGR